MQTKETAPATLPNWLLALVGAGVAFCAVIAGAPASLAPALARKAGVDIFVDRAEGTLWKGELQGVYAKGVRLGDIAFETRPAALARGRLAFDITVRNGALAGQGRASLAPNGEFSMKGARLLFDLSAANRYAILGQPMSGAVRADIEEVVVAPEGCIRADATLWTDVLAAPAKRFNAEALPLAGDGACDGRDLVVSLAGRSGDGAVAMTLRITPELSYTLSAEASPARTDVADALQFLGFERNEGAMSIATSGVIGAVGS